jgi:hypothetical protein
MKQVADILRDIADNLENNEQTFLNLKDIYVALTYAASMISIELEILMQKEFEKQQKIKERAKRN